MYDYDIIVVGGGHAGCEAALAAARMGATALLLTLGWESIADMPCNPSLGGPGKAQIIREIDALGGEMARNIDHAYLQIRLLNTGKGPAVHSLRAQADKDAYQARMREVLDKEENLAVEVSHVEEILTSREGQVRGVLTREGKVYLAPSVILATGTYLGGRVYIGDVSYSSGPHGQPASIGLTKILRNLGLQLARFKTGTSPRIARASINFSNTKQQPGHVLPFGFSYETHGTREDQVLCYLTYTTPKTHDIIKANLSKAPLYTGAITGRGPRYCPSIETKVMEFPDRQRHQVFLEPETRTGEIVYLGGLSTSLPKDTQGEIVHSVPGLEDAEIVRPGYAIEYDCLVPTEISPWLEVKKVPGLFTAGQINGTSGYEEAASQGLIAGINAVLKLRGQEPFVLGRSEAYIGVLIDDLVTLDLEHHRRAHSGAAANQCLVLFLRHYDLPSFVWTRSTTSCGVLAFSSWAKKSGSLKSSTRDCRALRWLSLSLALRGNRNLTGSLSGLPNSTGSLSVTIPTADSSAPLSGRACGRATCSVMTM